MYAPLQLRVRVEFRGAPIEAVSAHPSTLTECYPGCRSRSRYLPHRRARRLIGARPHRRGRRSARARGSTRTPPGRSPRPSADSKRPHPRKTRLRVHAKQVTVGGAPSHAPAIQVGASRGAPRTNRAPGAGALEVGAPSHAAREAHSPASQSASAAARIRARAAQEGRARPRDNSDVGTPPTLSPRRASSHEGSAARGLLPHEGSRRAALPREGSRSEIGSHSFS